MKKIAALAVASALAATAASADQRRPDPVRACFPAKFWDARPADRPCVRVRVHEDGGVKLRRGRIVYHVNPDHLDR